MIRSAMLTLVAVFSAPVAHAAELQADCFGVATTRSADFAEPVLKIVSRVSGPRLRFLKNGSDDEACPGGGSKCLKPAFVTPGDSVVIGARNGDFFCASFTGPKPKAAATVGWLPAAALETPPTRDAPRIADWMGEWRSGDEQGLDISVLDGKLRIEGNATFGASDPERVARGAVNAGSFEATVAPSGGYVDFATGPDGETVPVTDPKGECRVSLWRLGPYLAVADDGNCGGLNVTFTGVYRRD